MARGFSPPPHVGVTRSAWSARYRTLDHPPLTPGLPANHVTASLRHFASVESEVVAWRWRPPVTIHGTFTCQGLSAHVPHDADMSGVQP